MFFGYFCFFFFWLVTLVNIYFSLSHPSGGFSLRILGHKLLPFRPFPSPLALLWSSFASPCLRKKCSCSRVSSRWNDSHAKASLYVLWGLPQGNFWPTCTLFTKLWNLFNLLTSRRVLTEQGWVKRGTWTDGEEPVVMLQVHFPHRNASKPGDIHCMQVTHIV